MISPELLRRYPFFALLSNDELKAIAMIAEEKTFPKETVVFEENTPATRFYLLLEGDVDLIFSGAGEGAVVNIPVGSIAPGEVFGISAMIEPYQYTAAAKSVKPIKVIEINATPLRALCEVDQRMGYAMMRNIASAVIERLKYTQVELAAARS